VQTHIPDVKEVRGVGLAMSKLEHADLARAGIFSHFAPFYLLINFYLPLVWCKYTFQISVEVDKE
jgi:hypothetical protein